MSRTSCRVIHSTYSLEHSNGYVSFCSKYVPLGGLAFDDCPSNRNIKCSIIILSTYGYCYNLYFLFFAWRPKYLGLPAKRLPQHFFVRFTFGLLRFVPFCSGPGCLGWGGCSVLTYRSKGENHALAVRAEPVEEPGAQPPQYRQGLPCQVNAGLDRVVGCAFH